MTDTSHPEPIDFVLLHRFCAGDCSPDERAQVVAWATESADNAEELETLRHIVAQSAVTRPQLDRLPDWEEMRARLGVGRDRPTVRRASMSSVRDGRGKWERARSIAVGLAVVVGILVAIGVSLRSKPAPLAMQSYATGPAEREIVTLPDGTRLTLGPSTHLELARNFGEATRDLTLDGEALFVVTHDRRRPFRVRTRGVVVEDIGTVFDVKAYPGGDPLRVAVREGQVAISSASGGAPVNLIAGDVASLVGSGIAVTRQTNVAALTSWAQGGLAFDETPLREVIHDLARTFDLNITLADTTLGTRRITASFSNGTSAQAVLDVVTRVIGAQYQRNGRKVVIKQGRGLINAPDSGVFVAPLRTASSHAALQE